MILYVDPWTLFDHETITASYSFVAEVSSLDDYFYSSLDEPCLSSFTGSAAPIVKTTGVDARDAEGELSADGLN